MDCDKCTDLSNRHYNKHRKNTVKQSSHTSHYKNNNNNEVKPKSARKWSHSDLHFGINLIYETPLPQSDNEVI